MSKYRYIEIAPSRSAYDPIYLTFENRITHELIYRKALRWDVLNRKVYKQSTKDQTCFDRKELGIEVSEDVIISTDDEATQIVKHYIEMLKGKRS